MGAAGAEALASVFGYAYSLTDRCLENRTEFEGKSQPFGSFYEMAQENAWSRVLLGVHWNMDCVEGVRFGTVIGRKVNDLPGKIKGNYRNYLRKRDCPSAQSLFL
ncbi:MAG: hypothetical protein IPG32_04550 [Saprospirales bacterium]|nr:hypothetical protein [Saprospirales bacterium]